MPYAIGNECVDLHDQSCVQVCPVDCIYEGDRKLYINPEECIDCGACEPACPVTAIFSDMYARTDARRDARDDNARFFADPLPGKQEALGNPGGARKVGRVGADTAYVAARPPEQS